jgi:hypothetical protein
MFDCICAVAAAERSGVSQETSASAKTPIMTEHSIRQSWGDLRRGCGRAQQRLAGDERER